MDTLKAITIIGLITITPFTYDALTLTSRDVEEIKIDYKLTTNEGSLLSIVADNKLPQYDLSKISPEEITQQFIDVLNKLGDDFEGKENNLSKRIRSLSKEKTSVLQLIK